MNSRCGARTGPVRPYTTPVQDFCQFWLCQFPYLSCRIWKTLKIPVRGPYDACMGIARGTRGVLRIIEPNHKCTAVSSRTGPVAWCDQENSTDVKFLRAFHLDLRARNRTGDENRTGPVIGCDWGIRRAFIYPMFTIAIMQNTVIIISAMMRPDCTCSSSKSVYWTLEDVVVSVKCTLQTCYGLSSWALLIQLISDICHKHLWHVMAIWFQSSWECRIIFIKLDISYVNAINHDIWGSFCHSYS